MDGTENTFPMDITDPSSRPWNFRPEGYLVVILAGTEEAERDVHRESVLTLVHERTSLRGKSSDQRDAHREQPE